MGFPNIALLFAILSSIISFAIADHTFVFRNFCTHPVNPKIVNVNCVFSPRCSTPGSGNIPLPAISYTGGQPRTLNPNGDSTTMTVNRQWNGRIFHQTGSCGALADDCTMGEFNLDTGADVANAYDISNIQGFTNGMSIAVPGGPKVICLNADCDCSNAYPVNDKSGCGNDWPVKSVGAGDHTWTVTFCA